MPCIARPPLDLLRARHENVRAALHGAELQGVKAQRTVQTLWLGQRLSFSALGGLAGTKLRARIDSSQAQTSASHLLRAYKEAPLRPVAPPPASSPRPGCRWPLLSSGHTPVD